MNCILHFEIFLHLVSETDTVCVHVVEVNLYRINMSFINSRGNLLIIVN